MISAVISTSAVYTITAQGSIKYSKVIKRGKNQCRAAYAGRSLHLYRFCGRQLGVTLFDTGNDSIGEIHKFFSRCVVTKCSRNTGITTVAYAFYNRDLPQQRSTGFLSQPSSALLAEDIVPAPGQFRSDKIRHVLHQTKDRDINAFTAEHSNSLTGISKRNLLGSGYNYRTCNRHLLHKCKVY